MRGDEEGSSRRRACGAAGIPVNRGVCHHLASERHVRAREHARRGPRGHPPRRADAAARRALPAPAHALGRDCPRQADRPVDAGGRRRPGDDGRRERRLLQPAPIRTAERDVPPQRRAFHATEHRALSPRHRLRRSAVRRPLAPRRLVEARRPPCASADDREQAAARAAGRGALHAHARRQDPESARRGRGRAQRVPAGAPERYADRNGHGRAPPRRDARPCPRRGHPDTRLLARQAPRARRPVGTQITVQLRIPGFPSDAADGIGGGPILVRNGEPGAAGGRAVHPLAPQPAAILAPRSASSATGASSSWSPTAGARSPAA